MNTAHNIENCIGQSTDDAHIATNFSTTLGNANPVDEANITPVENKQLN
jgi:hypothetical protein